ncbi:hypothetical protein FB45DRAFT_788226 [Roridomyces roridus]|uniref:F-box domain-containing protein n=1 Tax=Roridomyces roridus TaxID=1738132 RepID=A0AAD7FS39_9AGAR|nr:hypothetical protein FB45DRAFT_788226 [Roridomyces roridus]
MSYLFSRAHATPIRALSQNERRRPSQASNFPRLRTVSLLQCFVHVGDWLPWAQLTSLTLRDVNPADSYLPILQRAVNLIHLKTISCAANYHHNDQLPAVTLPHLESLIMVDFQGRFLQRLDIFTLPSLHTLQLLGSFLGDDPIKAFASFISRSGCRLQKFLITGGLWGVHKSAFRCHFPEIPQIELNSKYDWFARRHGHEEDSDDNSGDTDSESE